MSLNVVKRHTFDYNSLTRANLYVTKVGAVHPEQIVDADLDVEYDGDSDRAIDSAALAKRLVSGATSFATYSAQIGDEMCCTDSVAFRNHVASVSVRENRRQEEIGNGSNPHWHQPTDTFSTYTNEVTEMADDNFPTPSWIQSEMRCLEFEFWMFPVVPNTASVPFLFCPERVSPVHPTTTWRKIA